ncbi:hypothetical protein BGZ76_009465 [Entomortierella beljakovae]|nr:hypothetical protein BGZ76_009465 [Entomortierella beljakovae]
MQNLHQDGSYPFDMPIGRNEPSHFVELPFAGRQPRPQPQPQSQPQPPQHRHQHLHLQQQNLQLYLPHQTNYIDSSTSFHTGLNSAQNPVSPSEPEYSSQSAEPDLQNQVNNLDSGFHMVHLNDTKEDVEDTDMTGEEFINVMKTNTDNDNQMEPVDPGNGRGNDPPKRCKHNKQGTNRPARGNYNTYVEQQISELFRLVFRDHIRVAVAARIVKMNSRTAQRMVKERRASREDNPLPTRRNQKRRGPAPALQGEHSKFLDEYFDINPDAVLDDAVDAIKSRFNSLNVSKTTVYNHITHRCSKTLRRAHRSKSEACSNAILDKRCIWAMQMKREEFKKRSIFIGDAEFYICSTIPGELLNRKKRRRICGGNHERIMIMGAFDNHEVLSVKTYISTNDISGNESSQDESTIAHHHHHGSEDDTAKENFMNFIEVLMKDLAKTKYAQEKYNIVIDESLVQHPKRVHEIVSRHGLKCILLPPGSRFLNPTEECWSKIRAKCHCYYSTNADIINDRILDAAKTIDSNDMEAWIDQSLSFIPLLLNKELKP